MTGPLSASAVPAVGKSRSASSRRRAHVTDRRSTGVGRAWARSGGALRCAALRDAPVDSLTRVPSAGKPEAEVGDADRDVILDQVVVDGHVDGHGRGDPLPAALERSSSTPRRATGASTMPVARATRRSAVRVAPLARNTTSADRCQPRAAAVLDPLPTAAGLGQGLIRWKRRPDG
jgi:hypothetical protein